MSTVVYKYSPQEAYQEASRSIRLAQKRGRNALDLSGLGIVELPPEIGRLYSIERLNIERNQLTELPAEIGKLVHLRELS